MSLYLKWTGRGRVPSHQGGKPIPVDAWTATVKNPVPCKRGWHACRWEDAPAHISNELWVCELDGRIVEGKDKVAASRLRLVEQVTAIDDRALRLFAADCAERVLPIFEREHPDDGRPREAIRVARLYVDGQATLAGLAAARVAAKVAASEVPSAVASDAAWAAAWVAATDPASEVARDAAWIAAWSAARAAERAAAWDAEAATWAAGVVARTAARTAARDAARAWQADRLLCHYAGLNPDEFARKVAA